MGEAPITKNETAEIKGQMFYESEMGGINCKTTTTATLQAGTTTGSTQFAVDGSPTSACTTQGLLALAGCTMETAQITELPWTIHKVSTQTLATTSGPIHTTAVTHQGGKCSYLGSVTLLSGTLTFHISEAEMSSISKLALQGTLNSSVGEFEFAGSSSVTPAGTFGL